MNWSSILQLIFTIFGAFETDIAEIEAGGTATTPAVVVGSYQGKPIYAWANLSLTKPA